MRILITGACGYVGSALTRLLLAQGLEVVGVDNLLNGPGAALALYGSPAFHFLHKDICDPTWMEETVAEIDAVIHLAAIVGDPACAQDPELAHKVNWQGALNIYRAAVASKRVSRFLFSSTCSNYGKAANGELLTETAELNPVSLYAKLKVQFESLLLEDKGRPGLTVTPLRFATVYGVSPRMRFDLTVNEFTRDAWHRRCLTVYGEQFWRPYCHVQDIAHACASILSAPSHAVHREVFNVGATQENYTKKMLADKLAQLIPGLEVEYIRREEDPRDYKVNFDKIAQTVGYTPRYTVSLGIQEILRGLSLGIFGDPYERRYSNI